MFKVGDRVYFDFNPNNPKERDQCGVGIIKNIVQWGTMYTDYDVLKDGDEDGPESYYYLEPHHGELIVLEEVYNSKLYKVMEEK